MPPRFSHDVPLPSLEQIERLWDDCGMLANIRDHSRVVCSVALTLSRWLRSSGLQLCPLAVQTGALLHDIAKTQCLGSPRRHDKEGETLLSTLGYPELAYLVGVHVNLPDPHPVDESFLVYYADKRVRHTDIVNLDERFDYIAERYGRGDPTLLQRIAIGRRRAKSAELQLFTLLPSHSPSSLEPDHQVR